MSEKKEIILSKASTYPISRLSANFQPINQIEVFEQSKQLLTLVAQAKLNQIMDQINFLKNQAKEIIMEAETNLQLHQASCAFEKRVGQVYYLYERDAESLYFSLLSPQDWNNNPPHPFKGAFKLEPDMSWIAVIDSESVSE